MAENSTNVAEPQEPVTETIPAAPEAPVEEAVPEVVEKTPEEKKLEHNSKRWEKLVSDRATAKAEAAMLRERLQAYEQPKQEPAASTQSGRPVAANYSTIEEYNNAVMDYVENVAQNNVTAAQRQQQEAQRTASFESKEAEFKKATVDYDEVISAADDVKIPMAAANAIISSDHGPQLRYFIATHPEEAAKMVTMYNNGDELGAVKYIGRLEARFDAEQPNTPSKKVSSAPPPIRPVNGKGSGIVKDIGDMNADEYRAWREKPENKRRFD